jgi:lysozyme family protein
MATSLFDRCIEVILKSEGGYQCDPADIGNYNSYGKLIGTNFGISARLFPGVDIKNLTREKTKVLYYNHYWQPMNLEGIRNPDLVLHIFDHGINAGKRTAIRMVQRLIAVKADGVCGPMTVKTINTCKPQTIIIEGYGLLQSVLEHYKYARYKYYTDLTMRRPVTQKYLKGWYNRISNTHF